MKTKLGQEQAFPMEQHDEDGLYAIHHGMSKRFYAACAAMQGILSTEYSKDIPNDKIVIMSYMLADELLKQENNGN